MFSIERMEFPLFFFWKKGKMFCKENPYVVKQQQHTTALMVGGMIYE